MKLALIQMKIFKDKIKNIEEAKKLLIEAADNGADILVLPEMFNCMYNSKYFRKNSEKIDLACDTISMLSKVAASKNVYIVGGSIPENDNEKLYNTSVIFDKEGKIIAKHRKMHLFDVDIEDGITFFESSVLEAGESSTVFDTEYGKIGVAICYDMRFPELIRKMTLEGAKLIIVPAAFNMTTGPAHWHTIAKSRALDNQIYFAVCSPARDIESSYVPYGHSIVSDPWGKVINELDEKEGILYSTIDFNYLDKIRNELPLLKHMKKNYD